MPPLPVIPNVIACHVKGTLSNGRQWVNTFHVLKGSGQTVAAAIALIDPLLVDLYATAHSGGGASLSSGWNANTTVTAIYYLPLDGTSATTIIAHAIPGTNGGDALSPATALTVTSQTGLRGRSKRGRVFLPPFSEGNNGANGAPTSGLITATQAQFNGFLADMTTAVVLPVVASYKFASQAIITDYVVRAQWSSRRKRLGRPQ